VSVPAIRLDDLPAFISRERSELALIVTPDEALTAEKRAAAIAELARRAELPVPVQNAAVLYRAEALERLAVLVDEGPKHNGGRGKTRPESGQVSVPRQRVAEGRVLARTGMLAEMRELAESRPDRPVSMDQILRRAKRREREQHLRLARERSEREARAEIASSPDTAYQLHHGSLEFWRPAGVDAIITDPPYVGDSIPLYRLLRDFAVDVLPEGAPLVVMTWQAILHDVIAALDHPALAYRWCLCWRYANTENTADHKRRVFDCWKPVLVYHAGAMPKDAPMIRDEIANRATDKDFHEWGQSVHGFERLVRSFTRPGETVCDPFLGGGTTAVAALAQARRFVGCDVAEECVDITRERLTA
jgi:site-specific DNA-methyltransferase (adenine-specific)